ncbi:MAG: 6-bladed beta-propeller, partial [Bacteroidales bacterium]|nr:6-bladed beta-propeller [Bacteroidales bacterium]
MVPVETTHDFLLADVDRVIFYKNKIIILDTGAASIFVVDASTGKVETHIHRKGRGPGDSMDIYDIAFDDRLEQILVFNNYKKLLYFALDGSFLKEEFITNESFNELTYDNGKAIFYNAGEGYGCFPYSLGIYDLQDHSWEEAGKDQKVDFPVRSYGCLLVKSKNIWFTPVLDFGLHRLNGNKIEVPYKLDQKPLSDELREKSISDILSFFREVADHDILHSINSIRETDHHIIFQTNRSGFLMMNKKEPKLFLEESVKDAYLGLELIRYFPHDGDDNRIMFVVFADKWLER